MHSRIAGTGSYLPAHILTNNDIARRIDTDDAWIISRTGMKERRALRSRPHGSHPPTSI